jgi:hypothetical protein
MLSGRKNDRRATTLPPPTDFCDSQPVVGGCDS